MCSDRRPRSAAALPLLCVVLLSGCGKQGDPAPRPRAVPQAAQDLTLRVRGDVVLAELSYPTSTLAGLPLEGLEWATLYAADIAAPPEGRAVRVATAALEAQARPVAVLAGEDLAAAVVGGRIRFRAPFGEAPLPNRARAYAVRTKALRGEVSPWSNGVGVVHREPPPAPDAIEVEGRKAGIVVRWSAVEAAEGYVVLRREAEDPEWGLPVATLEAEAREHLDRGALYGTRYVYSVLALATREPPIESAPRGEREIDYRDIFPPDPPRELRAVAVGENVRLIWEGSPDADLAGYYVERARDDRPFRRLAPALLAASEYTDSEPPTGGLRYRVVAVDRVGNESRSEIVETRRR
jgi:hypothetical protein